jgi:uncharacterized protein (DUF4213/DUF364 family)
MTLLETLIANLPEDVPVRSVLVGGRWVVVCSRHCGMASALSGCDAGHHSAIKDVGKLHLKSARELAAYALSDNPLEASLGVAAINSLLEVDESRGKQANASEVLTRLGRGKNVALVGHFPFIPQLRSAAGQLWVIEQNPGENEYPAGAASRLLPQAQVVAITGSALINHTLEDLLAHCPPEASVMVLGPSTPLSPVLFDFGATIISGTRVIDEQAVLRTVGQGASFRQVEGVRLLTFYDKEATH